MRPTPPLTLTREQATRLIGYIQTYRRHVLTQLAPSTERNVNQRLLQAIQGKLIPESERGPLAAVFFLSLTSEDVTALKTMVVDLLVRTAQEPETDRRNATMVDLSALKAMLEKLALYGPRRSYTNSLL